MTMSGSIQIGKQFCCRWFSITSKKIITCQFKWKAQKLFLCFYYFPNWVWSWPIYWPVFVLSERKTKNEIQHWTRLSLVYISGVSWPSTSKDISEPGHSRVFHKKFRTVYVVKGVWSLLTDLLFNRAIYWSRCEAGQGSAVLEMVELLTMTHFNYTETVEWHHFKTVVWMLLHNCEKTTPWADTCIYFIIPSICHITPELLTSLRRASKTHVMPPSSVIHLVFPCCAVTVFWFYTTLFGILDSVFVVGAKARRSKIKA